MKRKSTVNPTQNLFGFWTDFWLTSGISILFIGGLLLSGTHIETSSGDGTRIISMAILLQLLLNWPHFMISYRLLYQQPESCRRFPGATIAVPGLLVLLIMVIWFLGKGSQDEVSKSLLISYIMWLVASFYLAWHYVGQAWGCISTFSLLSKQQWSPWQKSILHWSLRLLIVWHVVWAAQLLPSMPWVGWVQNEAVYKIASYLALFSFVVSGMLVFPAWKKRQIDLRTMGVWFSIYLWYLAIYFDSSFIFWAQLSHALQYLVFASRVELNQSVGGDTKIPARIRVQLTYAGSVVAGALIFWQSELSANLNSATPTIIGLLAIAINIHHYYVDSAIWKLRDAPTRALLFGHLGASNRDK